MKNNHEECRCFDNSGTVQCRCFDNSVTISSVENPRGGTTCVTKCRLSVPFLPNAKKGHAESAFRDTCRTSSGKTLPAY